MPGVPSGRGCDGCRKQKKKCDKKQPQCSRCTRLGLTCIGSGQQRYVFKTYDRFQQTDVALRPSSTSLKNSGDAGQHPNHDDKEDDHAIIPTIVLPPRCQSSPAYSAFVDTIRSTTDLKYNLVLYNGDYLADVPRRIGSNPALDAAVPALVSAHADICARRPGSRKSWSLYNRALTSLRLCLEDQRTACETETLCAVTILILCQIFNDGGDIGNFLSHCRGSAAILKARGVLTPPRNEFEKKLLCTLRGPLLYAGLLGDDLGFSDTEWAELMQNDFNGPQPYTSVAEVTSSFAQLPNFIRRGWAVKRRTGQCVDINLANQVSKAYTNMTTRVLPIMLGRVEATSPSIRAGQDDESTTPAAQRAMATKALVHTLTERVYCVGLMIAVMLNRVMAAFFFSIDAGEQQEETQRLNTECEQYAAGIIAIAERSHGHRPLGSAYLLLCLNVAYTGIGDDIGAKVKIVSLIHEYASDFCPPVKNTSAIQRLEAVARWSRFEE